MSPLPGTLVYRQHVLEHCTCKKRDVLHLYLFLSIVVLLLTTVGSHPESVGLCLGVEGVTPGF